MSYQHNSIGLEYDIAESLLNDNGKLHIGDNINLDYMLTWAKINGVLYTLSLELKKAATSDFIRKEIEKVVEHQRAKTKELVTVTHDLITLCEHYGLHLIPMKTFLQYPYVDDDLDIILVENDNVAKCRDLLEKNEYRYLKSRSSLREPKKRFYFAKGVDNSGLRIHLHWAVSWNGVDYLDIKKVFERRRQIRVGGHNIPIPSVEDEILIMAAHAVHENRYILLGEMIQLGKLTRHGNIDWDYIIATARDYNWSAGLYLFLALSSIIMHKFDRENPVPPEVLSKLVQNGGVLSFLERSLPTGDDHKKNIHFPIVMPLFLTSFTFFNKFLLDLKIKQKSARELGRELLAYTAVDWAVFWRFGGELRELNRLKQK